MNIIETVKKNPKSIMGMALGLVVAGVSAYGALRGNNEDEDYDDDAEVVDNYEDDEIAEEMPSEETADEAE